ncbi:hypothetical protein ACOWPH_20890 [Anabaena sp. PCC 7938]|uniref:Uncharacterized protein n=1 Tax=Anabaena cylindrica (strain ATCC 27899 / PCC 7122) TaxID=272123 RepID=K9ZQ92_ANACC|nr:hypothetical protein [Anabaena sp. CCAP 1446/1C]AFZ60692.1 hypothetical protein Anacy_5371 [Anabaena cylindrica PCC 7122]MBY5282215.1 hypothetical protein [Anabaena sp. CCAP 1446/1C]BAY02223.1 hypothetical protein NIES19_14640 [Anabaena cylindrica PCC 7122]
MNLYRKTYGGIYQMDTSKGQQKIYEICVTDDYFTAEAEITKQSKITPCLVPSAFLH